MDLDVFSRGILNLDFFGGGFLDLDFMGGGLGAPGQPVAQQVRGRAEVMGRTKSAVLSQ